MRLKKILTIPRNTLGTVCVLALIIGLSTFVLSLQTFGPAWSLASHISISAIAAAITIGASLYTRFFVKDTDDEDPPR